MSAVQITGCSGTGKTTIAAVLARRGLTSIDADDDPLLARSVDRSGAVVEEPAEPAEPDFAWLARHSFSCEATESVLSAGEVQRLRLPGALTWCVPGGPQ